jgi:hypothetical protein
VRTSKPEEDGSLKTTKIGCFELTTYQRATRVMSSSSSSSSTRFTKEPAGQTENSGKEGTIKEEQNEINDMLT